MFPHPTIPTRWATSLLSPSELGQWRLPSCRPQVEHDDLVPGGLTAFISYGLLAVGQPTAWVVV